MINPGNPTGQCLTEANIRQVVEFCERNNLVILADEVYQANVYGDVCAQPSPCMSLSVLQVPFTSFRKVVTHMKSNVELISYHSVSKGMIGECGRRGGYMELINIDPVVVEQIYKVCEQRAVLVAEVTRCLATAVFHQSVLEHRWADHR